MTRPSNLKHAEAFCIMTYRAEDGSGEEERIWNSRDGVTPFMVALRSGKPAQHVDWHRDEYNPDYQPPVGSRIFVDMTPERARELAERNATHYWEDAAAAYKPQQQYRTKADLVQALMHSYLEREGAPDIIEVTGD